MLFAYLIITPWFKLRMTAIQKYCFKDKSFVNEFLPDCRWLYSIGWPQLLTNLNVLNMIISRKCATVMHLKFDGIENYNTNTQTFNI